MTTGHKVTVTIAIVLGIVLMVGSVAATYLVMSERQRVAVAQEKSNTAQAVVSAKNDLIKHKDDDIAERDQKFNVWTKQHDAEVAAVKTSLQASNALAAKGYSFAPQVGSTGTPTGDYVLSADKLIPLYQSLAKCDAREAQFNKCQSDLTDTTVKFGAVKVERDTFQQDRDQWRQTAQGGTKMQRTWFALKVGAAGAAGAAPGALIKDPKAAVIGAGVSALMCAVFCRK